MTDQPQLPPEPPPSPELPPPSTQQPPPGQGIPTQVPQPDRIQSEARLWAMLTHLTALSGFIGVPFGHLLGPLIVWLVKKDQIPLVDDQGKESLNFQLSMTIYGLVAALLMVVFIGCVLLGALIILDIVLVIIASVEANKGNLYRYPITIRFLK